MSPWARQRDPKETSARHGWEPSEPPKRPADGRREDTSGGPRPLEPPAHHRELSETRRWAALAKQSWPPYEVLNVASGRSVPQSTAPSESSQRRRAATGSCAA